MRHLRQAVRLAVRQPSFTGLIVLLLGLGVGGTTAMFSVMRAVLLKPLPYGDPNELVWMFGAFHLNDSAAVSPPDFLDYRARNTVFSSLGAMVIAPQTVTVARPSGPQRLSAAIVSADLITTLGVPPQTGRDFRRAEEQGAGAQAVIISHRMWRDEFGAAPDVLGRTVRVNDRVRTIVGVMPAGFALPFDPFIRLSDPVDLYVPLALDDPEAQVRRFHFLRLIGRLAGGASLRDAQAQMDVIARQLEAAYPENETWKLRLLPLHERLVGDLRQVLVTLMGAVLVLLMVACANVAGLLTARAVRRRPEFALRLALGASRPRLAGQLVVETLVLAAMGGLAGLLLGSWLVELLKTIGPRDLPRLNEIAVEPGVVAVALLVGGLASLAFGVYPALHAAGWDQPQAMRDGVRTIGSASRTRLRQGLVLVQVAMACTLLVSAGLFVQSLWRLQSVDPGFTARGVALARVSLPREKYADDARAGTWFSLLLERLESAPGVEAAGLGSSPPLTGVNDTAVHRLGRPPASDKERRFAQLRYVDGEYFAVLRMPVVAGRAFSAADRPGTAPVAVISRRMAEEFFPGEPAVGQQIVIDRGEATTAEVVGVVGDARLFGQEFDAPSIMYLSFRQMPAASTHIVLRLAGDAEGAGSVLRDAVRGLDPTVAVDRVEMLDAMLAAALAQPRFRTVLIVLFAAVALVLTLGGLYGTLAWMVAQRTQEFGIRVALGASPRELARLILREGSRIVLPGALLGLAGGVAAGRLIRGLLFQVTPFEPAVLVAVSAGLAALALSAMLGPARRAGRVDPAVALRAE
ncbi:MAG TPA: ABC transporter permease [Vicinamibacterales bacterium]|nr:ABC transporter permease [Vicinamibacterales bacterium]